jgi:hypothetical protein
MLCWGHTLHPDLPLQEFREFSFDSDVIDITIGEANSSSRNAPETFGCALTEGPSDSQADNKLHCWGESPPALDSGYQNSPTAIPCE